MGYLLTHALDDFGPALCASKDAFDRVSTYGAGTIKLGEHRVLLATAIPYIRKTSSRHFTWYERSAGGKAQDGPESDPHSHARPTKDPPLPTPPGHPH